VSPNVKEAWNDLYWSTGDGAEQTDANNNAQNLEDLLGAIVRISVTSEKGSKAMYKIPDGNYKGSSLLPRV